jgi:hypothetical protein
MVLLVLIWTLIVFIFIVSGFSVVNLILKISGQIESAQKIGMDKYFFFGFMTLSCLTGFLSILIPIGYKVLLIVSFLTLILFIFNFREIARRILESIKELLLFKKPELLFIFLILLILLAIVVQRITWYDTGLYHAQSIQWIRKFSVVPGLGNIHGRLAYNSMFLVISSLFTFQIRDVVIFPLNGICFIILTLRLYALFSREYQQGSKWLAAFYIGILLAGLFFMTPVLNSSSTDIICSILIIYTFILLLEQTQKVNEFNYVNVILMSLVVFNCVAYKISSVFLALVLLVNLDKEFRTRASIIIVIGILTTIPYLIRNYYLSGYLIYPFPSIDIFNVDWKIPYEWAENEKLWIVNWARRIPVNDINNLPTTGWIIPWFKSILISDKMLLFINSFSVVTFIIMLFRKDYLYAKIQLIIIVNLIFWFMMAPDPRFAYGFLIVGCSLTAAYVIRLIEYTRPAKVLKLKVIISCILLFVVYKRISIPGMLMEPSLLIVPAPFETVETRTLTSDFTYRVPLTGDRCFYSDIPCVPWPLIGIGLRGNNIQDGFKALKESQELLHNLSPE